MATREGGSLGKGWGSQVSGGRACEESAMILAPSRTGKSWEGQTLGGRLGQPGHPGAVIGCSVGNGPRVGGHGRAASRRGGVLAQQGGAGLRPGRPGLWPACLQVAARLLHMVLMQGRPSRALGGGGSGCLGASEGLGQSEGLAHLARWRGTACPGSGDPDASAPLPPRGSVPRAGVGVLGSTPAPAGPAHSWPSRGPQVGLPRPQVPAWASGMSPPPFYPGNSPLLLVTL